MKQLGIKDTAAYKIVRQITSHIYGQDTKLSEDDFVEIYKDFAENGGSWERLMAGDIRSVKIIEDILEEFINKRREQSDE